MMMSLLKIKAQDFGLMTKHRLKEQGEEILIFQKKEVESHLPIPLSLSQGVVMAQWEITNQEALNLTNNDS